MRADDGIFKENGVGAKRTLHIGLPQNPKQAEALGARLQASSRSAATVLWGADCRWQSFSADRGESRDEGATAGKGDGFRFSGNRANRRVKIQGSQKAPAKRTFWEEGGAAKQAIDFLCSAQKIGAGEARSDVMFEKYTVIKAVTIQRNCYDKLHKGEKPLSIPSSKRT